MKFPPKQVVQAGEEVIKTAGQAVEEVQNLVTKTEETFDNAVTPVRKSIIKRFPSLFLLAVTLGVSLTFFGIEQFLSNSSYFNGHPWVSFGAGVCILVATGTLYKKLG